MNVIESNLIDYDKDEKINEKTLETGQLMENWHSISNFLQEIAEYQDRDRNGPLIDQHHLNSLFKCVGKKKCIFFR